MRRFIISAVVLFAAINGWSAGVTLNAVRRPAGEVFAKVMKQTGKNFIYETSLLKDRKITVKASGESLEEVLRRIFADTGISWKISGDNVVLFKTDVKGTDVAASSCTATVSGYVREYGSEEPLVGAVVSFCGERAVTNAAGFYSVSVPCGRIAATAGYPGFNPYESGPMEINGNSVCNITMIPVKELEEVVVTTTPNKNIAMRSADLGHFNMTRESVMSTPSLFSEPDVIKSLQLLPGVAAGTEGFAGMYVHGGERHENLYMLDNVPLYQVNHLGGLFSAFNAEAIRNVDFHKTTFPAKYDGRLSSFTDVATREGGMEGHHGSFRLGLTSGQFDINGPLVKGKTTYSLAVRRSWLELITIPAFALANKDNAEKNSFRYAFTDLNAKVTHRFTERSKAHLMFYYGNDVLKSKTDWNVPGYYRDKDSQSLDWGNILVKAGWDKETGNVFSRFSVYWSKYRSSIESEEDDKSYKDDVLTRHEQKEISSLNTISDISARGDFSWQCKGNNIEFGANYTFHTYVPEKLWRRNTFDGAVIGSARSQLDQTAHEVAVYAGDNWDPLPGLRLTAGINASLYVMDGEWRKGISPRLSAGWSPGEGKWSFKGAYSRTVQYVHQLAESYVSLPTDRWVPLMKGSPAQTADKVAAGAFWNLAEGWTASAEGWWKWNRNIVDFLDDYYLIPTDTGWDNQLTRGKGIAKGIDFMLLKESGRLTGHVSYSLMWADKTFALKNGGVTFPARNDNRHKINVRIDWKISPKWSIGAAWTGMSGNRYTLPSMVWETPVLPGYSELFSDGAPAACKINNYRLPFYHRLDFGARKNTRHGYWTISIYNAYCNMNPIGIRRSYGMAMEWIDHGGNGLWEDYELKVKRSNKFQYIRLFPILPSFSYTWLF